MQKIIEESFQKVIFIYFGEKNVEKNLNLKLKQIYRTKLWKKLEIFKTCYRNCSKPNLLNPIIIV